MAGLVPSDEKNLKAVGYDFDEASGKSSKNVESVQPSGDKNLIDVGYDFNEVLEDFLKKNMPRYRDLSKSLSFKLDVRENENEYLIEAELPGVKKEEIHIGLVYGRLNISVEREEKIDEQNKNYIHKERHYSSMQRSIYLSNAKKEGITAKLDGGVLCITIPKAEKPHIPLKINIE